MDKELERAYDALMQADAAGNKEDAQQIADYIRTLESQQGVPGGKTSVSQVSDADLINVLNPTIGGAIAGEVVGPLVNKGVEAVQSNKAPTTTAPAAKVATPSGTPFNPRGVTIEQSVQNWENYGQAQNEAAKRVRREADLHKKYPGFTRAQPPAPPAPPPAPPASAMSRLIDKAIYGPVKTAGTFLGGAAQSGVVPWLGRALAGGAAGYQGADTYNRLKQGDVVGSGLSAIGTLGAGASFFPHPAARYGGAAISAGAEGLNQYLDYLKRKSQQPAAAQPQQQEQQMPVPMKKGGLVHLAEGGGKLGRAKTLAKSVAAKMSPGMSFGNMAPVNAQTVTNPLRNEFPGIYKRPDIIAQEAAARVASEDPMLKRLFGVTRDDLFEMSQRQGNVPGFIPGASKNPKGSAAAEAVMNPRNTQRLIDVLGEVKTNAPELYKGMHAWYTMDPKYHRMVELMGEEKAKQMYHRLNTFGGIESPNLPVPVEFNRASAANWLAEQGRMPDWIKYGGLRDKPLIEGIPADMIGIPGRVGHQRASESQRKFMETGEHGMISPKAPPYIQASSVPELGFQTDLPVGDAHWSRMIGLPDVRTSKEVSASVSTPELQQLAPWWKKDVAGAMDLESVPAQAIMWGAGSPQTGVKTAIGAGKLELQAIQIAEAAKRLGISPENARDLILMGKERAGKKEGGSTTPAWQRSEGKSPSGGLNALGRASYKRETGGELKAPQPEGGSRKKSFCARMGGMKKKLTSSKTANDPDSRINKALRKWKC
jgi:hypothetical protein